MGCIRLSVAVVVGDFPFFLGYASVSLLRFLCRRSCYRDGAAAAVVVVFHAMLFG